MKTYRSLKDLPGAPKGLTWEQAYSGSSWVECKSLDSVTMGQLQFTEVFILAHPEWWEEVKVQSLMEAVERVIDHLSFAHRSDDCNCFNNLRAAYLREKESK